MKRWSDIDTNSLRTHLGVPVIDGPGVTSPHNKQRLGEINMSAQNVKKSSRTKKSSSTTKSPLSMCTKASKDGMCTLPACLQARTAGLSCAVAATPSKQPESEKNESNTGTKHDQDKPALAYIPKAALYAEGQAFAYGAKKYDAWNYKNGIAVTRTLGAAVRHIVQFLDGEDKDAESGTHHLGCARANLAMALDTLENHPKFDDRFKGGKDE